MIYDPIGQGERLQYPDEQLKSRVGVGVLEHLYAGNQQTLVGEFLGAWRAWDGMRALDYLLSRDEVDPQRLGVTGNSGGGTMTTWLCGVEPRWSMAAPACFVTRFQRNLENELPADTEQCPPSALALGLEHEDFLAALAPKPVIILAKERDFFDVRGSEEAYRQLRRLYALLGHEDQVGLAVGPTTHGYSQENREAMYGWFHRFAGVDAPAEEPALKLEEDQDLWCAPQGQVVRLGSRSLPEFTADLAREYQHRRGRPEGKALRAAVAQLLRLDVPDETPHARILRVRTGRRFPSPYFTTYAVETEPGVQAIVYLLGNERHDARPPRGREQAILYVSHHSSDVELREDPHLRRFIQDRPEAAVYAMDVRGIGESRPNTCGADSFLQAYGCDYFYAVHGLMLDDPVVGQRGRDVRRVLQWLAAQGHTEIHLASRGWGAPPTALAALDAPEVRSLTLWDSLASYQDLAERELGDWPLAVLIPGVLRQFDLPDVYAELSKSLQLVRISLHNE